MKTTTLLFILFIPFIAFAQKNEKQKPKCIQKGNATITVGYGAPSIIRTVLKKYNKERTFKVYGFGPYMLKADYMLTNKWSIGVNFTYNFTRLSWMDDGYDSTIKAKRPYEYGVEAEEISCLVRTNYHFYTSKKIDLYAGLGLGYGRITLGTYTLAPQNQFSVGYTFPRPYSVEGTCGMRYYVTKNIGFYAELGIGKAWILFDKYFVPEGAIQAGINYKFLNKKKR